MRFNTEEERSKELERLIDEQEDDLSTEILFPETITPLRLKVLECKQNALTMQQKAALILSVIGKMTNTEIGVAMSCPESTVRGYIRIGYEKLREKYDVH
jgi:DNA-directed RNA polymerase specialized sigma24 family protein